MTLQPRVSPEPNRPFINRSAEIGLIESKLKDGREGKPMKSAVVCFWGAFGMGKSWLLQELARRYTAADAQLKSYSTTTARLDLNRRSLPSLWRENRIDREALIRELWKQFAGQLNLKAPAAGLVNANQWNGWKEFAGQLGIEAPAIGRISAEAWAGMFVSQVTRWAAQSATPIILLDTVDELLQLDEATFFWLEEHFIEPLALTNRVLFVLSSRGELTNWKRFQVRRRIDACRLTAFDALTAGQAVKADSLTSQALYRHAFGHPLFTEQLGTLLEQNGYRPGEPVEQELLIPSEKIQALLQQVVEEILRVLPPHLQRFTRIISVLRWVSPESLRFIAEAIKLEEPQRGDDYYLDQIIGELQIHHLLYWNSSKKCYEPDRVLRQIMAYELQRNDHQTFLQSHWAAFQFYRAHLEHYPQYLSRYLPELAYHQAILAKDTDAGQQDKEALPDLKTWWAEFLSPREKLSTPVHSEPWKELCDVLRKDAELEQLAASEYQLLLNSAEVRAQMLMRPDNHT